MSEVPSMYELFHPCLQLVGKGATNGRDCLPGLRGMFALTDDQMNELVPRGVKSRIRDRAEWAIFHMTKAGQIERPRRGYHRISEAGRSVLQSGKSLDWMSVQPFPEYIVWKRASGRSVPDETVPTDYARSPFRERPAPPSASLAATPDEVMDAAFAELQAGLAEELLEQVLSLTPARFERLIVDLLLAMGYGDGRAEMGQAIGRSGDGGIDGVVNEDKLGLDAVYIQAKRYAPENTIGSPALDGFIGAMTKHNATKGVFVTTSSFSKAAHDILHRIPQRVVLIDGARLARLMIDHGVGVRIDKTYVLRSIDANFFDVN